MASRYNSNRGQSFPGVRQTQNNMPNLRGQGTIPWPDIVSIENCNCENQGNVFLPQTSITAFCFNVEVDTSYFEDPEIAEIIGDIVGEPTIYYSLDTVVWTLFDGTIDFDSNLCDSVIYFKISIQFDSDYCTEVMYVKPICCCEPCNNVNNTICINELTCSGFTITTLSIKCDLRKLILIENVEGVVLIWPVDGPSQENEERLILIENVEGLILIENVEGLILIENVEGVSVTPALEKSIPCDDTPFEIIFNETTTVTFDGTSYYVNGNETMYHPEYGLLIDVVPLFSGATWEDHPCSDIYGDTIHDISAPYTWQVVGYNCIECQSATTQECMVVASNPNIEPFNASVCVLELITEVSPTINLLADWLGQFQSTSTCNCDINDTMYINQSGWTGVIWAFSTADLVYVAINLLNENTGYLDGFSFDEPAIVEYESSSICSPQSLTITTELLITEIPCVSGACEYVDFDIYASESDPGYVVINTVSAPSGEPFMLTLNDGVGGINFIQSDSGGNITINNEVVELPVQIIMGEEVSVILHQFSYLLDLNILCDVIDNEPFGCNDVIEIEADQTLSNNIQVYFQSGYGVLIYIDAYPQVPDFISVSYEGSYIISPASYLNESSLYIPAEDLNGDDNFFVINVNNAGLPNVDNTRLKFIIKCCNLDCDFAEEWIDSIIDSWSVAVTANDKACEDNLAVSSDLSKRLGVADLFERCIPANKCVGAVSSQPTFNPIGTNCGPMQLDIHKSAYCRYAAISGGEPNVCIPITVTATHDGLGSLGGGKITLTFGNASQAQDFYDNSIGGQFKRIRLQSIDCSQLATDFGAGTSQIVRFYFVDNSYGNNGPYNLFTLDGSDVTIEFAPITEPCGFDCPLTSGSCIECLICAHRKSMWDLETIVNYINGSNLTAIRQVTTFEADPISESLSYAELYWYVDFASATNGICDIRRKFKFKYCGGFENLDPDNWYIIEVDYDNPAIEIGEPLNYGSSFNEAC